MYVWGMREKRGRAKEREMDGMKGNVEEDRKRAGRTGREKWEQKANHYESEILCHQSRLNIYRVTA